MKSPPKLRLSFWIELGGKPNWLPLNIEKECNINVHGPHSNKTWDDFAASPPLSPLYPLSPSPREASALTLTILPFSGHAMLTLMELFQPRQQKHCRRDVCWAAALHIYRFSEGKKKKEKKKKENREMRRSSFFLIIGSTVNNNKKDNHNAETPRLSERTCFCFICPCLPCSSINWQDNIRLTWID